MDPRRLCSPRGRRRAERLAKACRVGNAVTREHINHFALSYPPLAVGLEHPIDLGAQRREPGDLTVDGGEMRFGDGVDGRA